VFNEGSIVRRGKNRFALVLDLGYVVRPDGTRKRRQRWVKFHGSKKQAGEQLAELVRAANRNEFIEPTKLTVGEWLTEWLEKSVKVTRRIRTYNTYKCIVTATLIPSLGAIRLQALRPIDVQHHFERCKDLKPRSIRLHAAILSSAMKSALKNGLVTRNVVPLADGKPRVERYTADDVQKNVLDVAEARRLLAAAKAVGPRVAAFYALAVDSGARKGELGGLKWADVDLDSGRLDDRAAVGLREGDGRRCGGLRAVEARRRPYDRPRRRSRNVAQVAPAASTRIDDGESDHVRRPRLGVRTRTRRDLRERAARRAARPPARRQP
jgi:integrase